jgi:N-acetylglutamate synthase-like GNAT family acetyltransferase
VKLPEARPGIAAQIRRARADEADDLTALALRSKAFWGYDAAFMAACVPALTLSSERIAAEPFFVLEAGGQVIGYAGLRIDGADAELTNLFVDPWAIGRGYGGQLWQHAIKLARALGATRLRIESDPFAEAFYRAMGAERIGETPSDAIPDRMLPLLRYILPDADEATRVDSS